MADKGKAGKPKVVKMKPAEKRRRKQLEKIASGNVPKRIALHDSGSDDMPLAWRFSLLDEGHPDFCYRDLCLDDHEESLLARIAHWETTPSSEVFDGRVGKLIPITGLADDARKRIYQAKLDDFEALWELQVAGAPRIWGVRRGNCFYVIWWDPGHMVCPIRSKYPEKYQLAKDWKPPSAQ